MNKSLLDTDILSDILKGINRTVVARAVAYRTIWSRYTISTIMVLEIVKGLHKVRREERIKQFLAGLSFVELLPLDLAVAVLAGRIYADLERIGQSIGHAIQ